MIQINVNRTLEVANVTISKDVLGVYVRWEGSKTFNFVLMQISEYNKALSRAKSPECFTSKRTMLPCRSSISGKHKSSYKSHLYLFDNDKLVQFEETRMLSSNSWMPKSWMEEVPHDYTLTWFCNYDHFLANADMSPRPVATAISLTESCGYDIPNLREHLKQFDDVSITYDSYVPGNGKHMDICVKVSVDDYLRYSINNNQFEAESEIKDRLGINEFYSDPDDEDE